MRLAQLGIWWSIICVVVTLVVKVEQIVGIGALLEYLRLWRKQRTCLIGICSHLDSSKSSSSVEEVLTTLKLTFN